MPVPTQPTIFLYLAGHYGDAASPEAIGHWAGVSLNMPSGSSRVVSRPCANFDLKYLRQSGPSSSSGTLHHLILRLEGENFGTDFREQLYEAGRGHTLPQSVDVSEEECSDEELRQARHRAETGGQRLRRHLMARLFDSPLGSANRR